MLEVHGKEDESDRRIFFKPTLPTFQKDSVQYTWRELITYAINAHAGKATQAEIATWIRDNSCHHAAMEFKVLKAAVNGNLSNHDSFYGKKIIKNSKREGYWSIHKQRWQSALKRKKLSKKGHKIRTPKH